MSLRRTRIAVSQDRLDDLRDRLSRSRVADAVAPGEGWRYGVPGDYLRSLIATWTHEFEWRAQEARMNRHEHVLADVEGVRVHALVERGTPRTAGAVVLTHGWPWTFWDYERVIEPLAHPERCGAEGAPSFDVVVPSLPGYGFSSPLSRRGITPTATARLWVALMRELGFRRFLAHGADWGQRVTLELGRRHEDAVDAIHLVNAPLAGLATARPWADAFASIYRRSDAPVDELVAWERTRASHVAVHGLDPQTLAHAMHDSPAGLCAWLVERRRAWSDCGGDVESVFTREELLTAATIYWVTDTFASAARMYWEVMNGAGTAAPGKVRVPAAISVFARDAPPRYRWDWLPELFDDLRAFETHDRGGHFAPVERPDVVVDAVRRLRASLD